MAFRRRHAFASALSDIFPVAGIVIDGRRSGAARAGGAIVLAGQGDAVALVGSGLCRGGPRLGGGGERGGEREGEGGGGDGGSGVHPKISKEAMRSGREGRTAA